MMKSAERFKYMLTPGVFLIALGVTQGSTEPKRPPSLGPGLFGVLLLGVSSCRDSAPPEGVVSAAPADSDPSPADSSPSPAERDSPASELPGAPGLPDPGPLARGDRVLRGLTVIGPAGPSEEPMDLLLREGRVEAVVPSEGAQWIGQEVRDLQGYWAVPAWIDSHVHLSYLPEVERSLEGGLAAAVDMAAPADDLDRDTGALRVLRAGPMITAPGGYPTQSWGRDGYGWECADAEEVEGAIRELAQRGAALIKIPLGMSPELSDEQLQRARSVSQELGLPLMSHAMTEAGAARAAQLGFDGLVHIPSAALSEDTLAAWSEGVIIPTLAAFGSSQPARDNLRRLHEAGATVLYGTDLGNVSTPGILASELEGMRSAGMSPLEILGAGTWEAARWWELDSLGELRPGADASLLVLSEDPLLRLETLSAPHQVWIRGEQP